MKKKQQIKRSFFREVVLFQGDPESQLLGILAWMLILLTLAAIGASIWLAIFHPDKFEIVMRTWGLWLE